MITAIIRNKENTLVLELPHSIYDIYEKLQSIGIMQPPKQIPLTDNEGEDIGVKLFSESDFGQHLLLTLNEKNTIADANMLTLVIGADVHKGFNKHTGTYNHISKNAHFSLILFCGTMYLQRRILHDES